MHRAFICFLTVLSDLSEGVRDLAATMEPFRPARLKSIPEAPFAADSFRGIPLFSFGIRSDTFIHLFVHSFTMVEMIGKDVEFKVTQKQAHGQNNFLRLRF